MAFELSLGTVLTRQQNRFSFRNADGKSRPKGPTFPRGAFSFFGIPEMAQMKTVSLIAAELKNETSERHLDIVSIINTVDDELKKITNKLKDLEERVDILEHE
jgi:hypothetical protein